eukprot:gene6615-6684_t
MTILNGTTFKVPRSSITTVIGPNGAGKSTVFKTIFGLLKARTGTIRFNGQDVTNRTPRQLIEAGICYVPQGRNIFPQLSVRQNIKLGAVAAGRDITDMPARIEAALDRFPALHPDQATRKPDAERTRRDILRVASEEFAEHGLSGARVDAIAARTQTTKRMIYYYFGSKEGLYLQVLEHAYRDIRDTESKLELSKLPPETAITRLIEATFDYQDANPGFIRLVSIENIHHGKFLKQSESIRSLNVTVIDAMQTVIARGQREGVFAADYDVVDLHMLISAVCFFRVANKHTFGTLFDIDLGDAAIKRRHKKMLVDAVLGLLRGRSVAEPVTARGVRRA